MVNSTADASNGHPVNESQKVIMTMLT